MITKANPPLTPLSSRADRTSQDVRTFEEAVIALRGRWPATATGLCVGANSLFGFSLSGRGPGQQEQAFRARVEEALRLLEALDGPRRSSASAHLLRASSTVAMRPAPGEGRSAGGIRVESRAAPRGVAQLGSAFGWGPKGRWFKSSRPDYHGAR